MSKVYEILSNLEAKVDKLSYQYDMYQEEVDSAEARKAELEEKLELLKESLRLCQACLEDQVEARVDIETMVTEGLHRVFPEYDLAYRYDPVYKADNVSLSGVRQVIEEHGVVQDVRRAHGYGLTDVVCALQDVIFLKMIDGLSPVKVWDEALAYTNYARIPLFLDFVEELAKIDPFQYVFITNNKLDDAYITHKFVKEGKVTTVEHL